MPAFHKTVLIAVFLMAMLVATCDSARAQNHGMHAGPVMNYHRIDDRLVTGGHFVDDGLEELKAQGVTVVIDLRDKPPAGQKEKLAQAGIEWINVPIVWKNPRAVDFDRFEKAMQAHRDDHVMVQCAANYRASAMTFLYRVVTEQTDEETAVKDLNAVWVPEEENQQWSEYIETIKLSAR